MNIKALSGADLARCFGVDRSMVTRWKRAGMPETKGVFSLPECIRWRLEREADALAPKNSVSSEGEKWLTRFRKERAKTAYLDRKSRQGELMSKEVIIAEWGKRVAEVKQSLLGLPVGLPALLEGKDLPAMRSIIRAAAIQILEGYCRPGAYTPAVNKNSKGHENGKA